MGKMKITSQKVRQLLIILSVAILVCYLAFVFYHFHNSLLARLSPQKQLQAIEHQFKGRTVFNCLVLIVLTALGSAVPFMSNAVLAIFNGVVFGPWLGMLMNISANTLGNVLQRQVLSRVTFLDKDEKVLDKLPDLEAIKNPYLALVIGYAVPFIPTLMVNEMSLHLDVFWYQWLLCLLLGVTPSSTLYAFGGDAIIEGNLKKIAILACILLVFYFFWKRQNSKKD